MSEAAGLSVLHSESSLGWGGQENRTLNEMIGLAALGARVAVACQPGARLGERAREQGFPVHEVAMRGGWDLPAVLALQRAIREAEANVVNTHSGRDGLLAGLAARLSRRRPVLVRTRHLALPIGSRFGYARLPHRVVTVSEYVRGYLMQAGVPGERVSAVPTGVDLARFDPAATGSLKQELGLAPGTPLVGTVAILRKKKGHALLLEAIAQVLHEVPAARFAFAGDGPQRPNIEHAIAERGLAGKVFLLGLRRDIANVLASFDLFVLPTLQEALGTSFVEAMAMARPCIGSRTGGVPEVVRDGATGLLVPPGEAAPLAQAIAALLRDPQRARAMGEAGRRLVEQRYSVQAMCRGMLAVYRELLAAR